MAKYALLIGVSEYESGLNPLPASVKDVEALQRILQNPEIGSFAEVTPLINPTPQEMQEAVETLFAARKRDDLVLLFFSGHGIKDDSGKLYFGTRITRKTQQGELVKSTAVPANFVHDIMESSRSKRQVVILDCCFGGAFAEGLAAKGTACVDIKEQLGGEGRAILTSSTSTQYSFEQEASNLSVYTRYLIEGIETGLADQDNDGMVSVDELHEYASSKVREVVPAMKPEIYAIREGFKIHLLQAPVLDPKVRYRKEVERLTSQGEISEIGRCTLDFQRERLGISRKDAAIIEAEVIEPYREYQQNLQHYKRIFDEASQRNLLLSDHTKTELKILQQTLGLLDEDINRMWTAAAERLANNTVVQDSPLRSTTSRRESSTTPSRGYLLIILAVVTLLSTLVTNLVYFYKTQETQSSNELMGRDQAHLEQAQQLANTQQFREAIDVAEKIYPGSPVYERARYIIQNWKVEECRLYKEKYEQGDEATRKKLGPSGGSIRQKCNELGIEIYGGGR